MPEKPQRGKDARGGDEFCTTKRMADRQRQDSEGISIGLGGACLKLANNQIV